jgi:hypothetical protein
VARSAEITLPVVPVSHRALVSTGVGSFAGGFPGSKASETETSVMMRSVRPVNLMVKAWNVGGGIAVIAVARWLPR